MVIPERTFSLKNNLKSTLSEEDLLNIGVNNSRINHQNINNMTGLTTLNQKIAQMTQEFTDKIVQLQTIQPSSKQVGHNTNSSDEQTSGINLTGSISGTSSNLPNSSTFPSMTTTSQSLTGSTLTGLTGYTQTTNGLSAYEREYAQFRENVAGCTSENNSASEHSRTNDAIALKLIDDTIKEGEASMALAANLGSIPLGQVNPQIQLQNVAKIQKNVLPKQASCPITNPMTTTTTTTTTTNVINPHLPPNSKIDRVSLYGLHVLSSEIGRIAERLRVSVGASKPKKSDTNDDTIHDPMLAGKDSDLNPNNILLKGVVENMYEIEDNLRAVDAMIQSDTYKKAQKETRDAYKEYLATIQRNDEESQIDGMSQTNTDLGSCTGATTDVSERLYLC